MSGYDAPYVSRSQEESAPQLAHDEQRFGSDDHARVPQDERSAERDLVLPKLIVEPPARREMNGPVDLDHHSSAITAHPLGVEVAPPSARLDAHRLLTRRR
jgi:hypothetical protein